jgi:hypothetical protein
MIQQNKKNMTKLTTQITSILAHGICKVWAYGRSFSNKNNFDYFIRAVRPSSDKLPYIHKSVSEDCYTKNVELKVGNIVIEYGFEKNKVVDSSIDLFHQEYDAKATVVKAIVSMTQQQHHNNSVLQFSKHRKDNDGVKYRKSNT